MNLAFDDQQDMLRATARAFLADTWPVSKTRAAMDDPRGFDREVWRRAADLGWFAPAVPEEFGGGSVSGQSIVDLVALAEELGRAVFPGPFLGTNVVALAIAEFGSDEQRNEHLPAIAVGDSIAAWCFTEPSGLWDPGGVAMEAREDGGDLVLDGTKSYVEGATAADVFLVTARRNGALVQLVIRAQERGITVTPHATLDLTRRLSTVAFDDVRVPWSDVLGDPGDGEAAVARQRQVAVVLICADSVGAADQVLETSLRYANDRSQFGRTIGSFQAIKHKAATMKVLLEGSRAATYYAALAVQDRLDDAALAVAVAKEYVGGGTVALAEDGVQIHGGIGFTWEHDLHLYLRRLRANDVLYGDRDGHREDVVQFLGA